MPTPAVIEEILADPAFHANLHARAAALAEGSHPEDRQQNTDAAGIIAQAKTASDAKGFLAQVQAKLVVSRLLVDYINAYFPNL